jgi:hypothetical protein
MKPFILAILSISLSVCLWLYSTCGSWPLFQFLNLYKVGRTPWTGDQPVARPLPTHKTTQTQNKCTQTSMPLVGFEPTIPAFERAKAVHGLDHAATVIGLSSVHVTENCKELNKGTGVLQCHALKIYMVILSRSGQVPE